jgi:hypothetical protein
VARGRLLVLFSGALSAAVVLALALGPHGRSRPVPPPVPPPAAHRPAAHRIAGKPAAPVRPPQFVVVSFDGSGGARMWGYWRAVARRAHAHFTFFLSGVYLLEWAHHARYRPPRHAVGASDIGFAEPGGDLTVAGTLRGIAAGYRDGHEIGTHFNGHFCGPAGVARWTAGDWTSELAQFDALLFRGHRLPFDRSEIAGARTPCLEGNLAVLDQVLARHGLRYDASRTALLGTWPSRRAGVWSVPLLELPYPGHTYRVVSMDYNFMANQIGESPARIESETSRAIWSAFRTSYLGNRAPFSFGQHFESWESWAYDHALTRFLLGACRLPDVRCVTIRELVDWLAAQPPARLRRFESGRFPRLPPRALLNRR